MQPLQFIKLRRSAFMPKTAIAASLFDRDSAKNRDDKRFDPISRSAPAQENAGP